MPERGSKTINATAIKHQKGIDATGVDQTRSGSRAINRPVMINGSKSLWNRAISFPCKRGKPPTGLNLVFAWKTAKKDTERSYIPIKMGVTLSRSPKDKQTPKGRYLKWENGGSKVRPRKEMSRRRAKEFHLKHQLIFLFIAKTSIRRVAINTNHSMLRKSNRQRKLKGL